MSMPSKLKEDALQVKEEANLSFIFKYPELSNSIHAGFREQRQDEFLLDVTLRCGPVSIRAHKVFLASFSAYFRALFKFEPTRNEFQLHEVDGQSLALLVDYAYSGELVITADNVQDVLQTANFINHDPVCDACCSYLKKNLCLETCFDIQQLAVSLGRTQLLKDAKLYALEHFEEISNSAQFLALSAEMLTEYLKDDGLVVCEKGFLAIPRRQDELVKEAIQKYITSKGMTGERRSELLQLLSLGERSTTGNFRTLPGLRHKDSTPVADTYQVVSEEPSEIFIDIEVATKPEVLYVTGMQIYMRRWDTQPVVGGILVYYSNGKTILHGAKDYNHEIYEFHLDLDERIVGVKFCSGWMIDQMSFATSNGRIHGPYGGPGGSERNIQPPAHAKGAYLACVAGTVDVTQGQPAVRRLLLTWGYYHKEEDEEEPAVATLLPLDDDDEYDHYHDVYDDYDGEDDGDDGQYSYHSGGSDYDHDAIYDLV